MALLTPIALVGALLAIPIVLLYMLRLRRREVVVSSTFLWQQIVRDSEANTPWQRLRRNLLLLLQLIILALLVLALARPFITVPAVTNGQIELLLDASASMKSSDMPNGETRFDEAKRQALSIVDTLGQDDTMTIIRVANVAEVIAPATRDPVMLRAAINSALPSEAQADWVGALTLASADAINVSDFNMVVISDGGLGNASGLPGVPGKVKYIPIGRSSDNLAITALSTRALAGQAPELFAEVTNYGQQDTPVIFDLRVDGNLFSAKNYTVKAGSSLPIVTTALPDNFSLLQAGLTTPTDSTVPDYLAEDNTAWTVSIGSGTRRALLMSASNLFLEQVLRSMPSIEAFKGDIKRPLPTDKYDLYILDGWLPADGKLPDGDLLIINPPSSTSLFTVGADVKPSGAIKVKSNDPRTTFVNFKDVNILKFKALSGADWADPLVTTDNGPLVLAGEQDGRQIAIMTFDIHDSDLPLQITWPILMSNLLEWFAPSSIISVPNGLQVGASLPIRPPLDATGIRVTLPDGSSKDLTIDRQTVVFADTQEPGLYKIDILKGSDIIQSAPFAVNLFAPIESNITPQQTISLSGNTISPATRDEIGQQEFWPWAALLALLVLMIEWLVYQRRMQARTVFQPFFRQSVQGVAR
ncbi:MAG: VWA domain-containing protein [Anaerolineae bacterium]|nr:VWA domain-containing protein [Anaerolineae bacterium]